MVAEFKCLAMFGFSLPHRINKCYLSIEGPERWLRQIFILGMFICYMFFLLFEVLLVGQDPCCGDVWLPQGYWYPRRVNGTGEETWHVLTMATVSDTAYSTYL